MIIDGHKAIFVHIQKTGGNSISVALGEKTAQPHKHFTAEELRRTTDAETWERYFKFSFVRNPWDRLVSWWAMIDAHRPAFEAGKPLNKFQTLVLTKARNFNEFIMNFDDEVVDPDGVKSIYRNQIDYLTNREGYLLVDFVGKTERIEEDFKYVTSRIFGQPQMPLPHVNKSAHPHYSQYYSADLEAIIGERFRRDIEYFGYAFERRI